MPRRRAAPAKKATKKAAPTRRRRTVKKAAPARRHAGATPNPAIAAQLAKEERLAADHREYIAAAIRRGAQPFRGDIEGLNQAQARIRDLTGRLYS